MGKCSWVILVIAHGKVRDDIRKQLRNEKSPVRENNNKLQKSARGSLRGTISGVLLG